jgi:hypothetical protein
MCAGIYLTPRELENRPPENTTIRGLRASAYGAKSLNRSLERPEAKANGIKLIYRQTIAIYRLAGRRFRLTLPREQLGSRLPTPLSWVE